MLFGKNKLKTFTLKAFQSRWLPGVFCCDRQSIGRKNIIYDLPIAKDL